VIRRLTILASIAMALSVLVHEWLSAHLIDAGIAGALLGGATRPEDLVAVSSLLAVRLAAILAFPIWIMLVAASFARPIRTRIRHSRGYSSAP
jgi:hypothetical protein